MIVIPEPVFSSSSKNSESLRKNSIETQSENLWKTCIILQEAKTFPLGEKQDGEINYFHAPSIVSGFRDLVKPKSVQGTEQSESLKDGFEDDAVES